MSSSVMTLRKGSSSFTKLIVTSMYSPGLTVSPPAGTVMPVTVKLEVSVVVISRMMSGDNPSLWMRASASIRVMVVSPLKLTGRRILVKLNQSSWGKLRSLPRMRVMFSTRRLAPVKGMRSKPRVLLPTFPSASTAVTSRILLCMDCPAGMDTVNGPS